MRRLPQPARCLPAILAMLTIAAAAPAPALADEVAPGVFLDTNLRFQAADLHNPDLGTSGDDNVANVAGEARFQLTARFNEDALFFWEGRAVVLGGRGGYQSNDTGGVSGNESFLEWRQSYFEFDNIGDTPFGAKIGRQRLREPYGVWWNQNYDAVKAGYDSTLFRGEIAVGEDLFSYSTADDDFGADEQDITRIMAEGSWQYYYENFFEARVLVQNDHSSIFVGQVQDPTDLDTINGDFAWAGLRAAGKTKFVAPGGNKTHYRFDLVALTGDENMATITPAGLVTAVTPMDVSGWAFDGGVDIPLPNIPPLVHIGYAYGSGDGNLADTDDDAFRQNGIHGNFSKIGALTENTDNYGTVLRPELSNIHVFSAGATTPVFDASDAGIIYRYYRLDEPAAALASTRVMNALNGVDRDLGHGVDLMFNMDVLEEMHWQLPQVENVKLRSSLGFFHTGDAFGPNDGETAVRGLVELKIKL